MVFNTFIVVFYIMDFFDLINHILCEGSDSVDISNISSSDSPKDKYVKKEDVIVTSKEVLDKVGDVVTTIVKDAVGPFIVNTGSAGGAIGAKIISSMPAGSSITH